ncbi:MAG: UDP-N-acetylmuramoyl-L-alanyl-D-glutamate--2,6-diaminopimelate ligase [Tissierellaceae bacterium]|nr:UDP-N-acetylmuramoyl-L-alanyl-D-glutamate--2,6-diaminopimelate ligase [Tissierellaceae bacterium]
MLLSNIIGKYPTINFNGDRYIEITGIEHNSNRIKSGNLFIAQKGYNHDGHNYIDDAIRNGASVIVKSKDVHTKINATTIDVIDTTDALGYFSAKYYHQPWTNMNTIGITGTNGKTTTSYIIKNILEKRNEKVGIIGTMGVLVDNEILKTPNTTPDSLEIQKNLNIMIEKNIESCIMEVSSHALEMKRVKYMDFDIGIFTNLSREHLDYHKDMENYFKSKLKLFLKTNRINVINTDDPYGRRIINLIGKRVDTITYGIRDKADVCAYDIIYDESKPRFLLKTPKGDKYIQLKIPGEFNIYNALAAAACCYGLGIDINIIKEGLESFNGVKGRFELIESNKDFNIIIDFAHTPDGIKEALKAVDKFTKGRKIIVFGAGGDRDKSKRPEMGKIAGQYSDFVIVTSDNPRNEDPQEIAEDIVKGLKQTNTDYKVILDRKEAINYAIINSVCNDTILITGKGHEDSIIMNGRQIPFDEKKIVLDILDKIKIL